MQSVNKIGVSQQGQKNHLEKRDPDLRQRENPVPDPDPHEKGSDQQI
jgi:hypothetical protein